MKTFSSLVPSNCIVDFAIEDLKEDFRVPYHEIGCLSAQLVFGFMAAADIEEGNGETSPYNYICRYLKGSIPGWRLSECLALKDVELAHLPNFRRYLRAVLAGKAINSAFVYVNPLSGSVFMARCGERSVGVILRDGSVSSAAVSVGLRGLIDPRLIPWELSRAMFKLS